LREFAAYFSSEIKVSKTVILAADELRPLFTIPGRTLLKIDVEGYEPELLQSLRNVINETSPDIILEVLEVTANQLNALNLGALYRLFHMTAAGIVEREAFVSSQFRNYVLIARSETKSPQRQDGFATAGVHI
jgi:hypothetical protein